MTRHTPRNAELLRQSAKQDLKRGRPLEVVAANYSDVVTLEELKDWLEKMGRGLKKIH